jgi:penicillin amidase
MQARSVPAMIEAGRAFVTPAVNLTAVDADHVVLQMLGRMPARDPAHPTLGRMPAPGWHAATPWRGTLPYAANPRVLDPEEGALGNTNNRTVTRPFPGHVSFDWGDTERIRRLRALLSSRPRHAPDDFAAMQADAISPSARRLVPLLLDHAGPAGAQGDAAGGAAGGEGQAGEAQAALAAWDGAMRADRPEPLIYAAWVRALHEALIADLGPLSTALTRVDPVFLTRVLQDEEGAAAWCGGACGPVVRAARDEALAEITRSGRVALDELRWGTRHRAMHDHPALGAVPLVARIANIRHPSPGGDDTLLRGLTRGGEVRPFDNVHASGYRGLYDMAAPDASRFVLATGQSGHPLSPHYRDQNRLWRDGGYLPMQLDDIRPDRGGADVLTLAPAG